MRRAALFTIALCLVGCGASGAGGGAGGSGGGAGGSATAGGATVARASPTVAHAHPQVVEPTAGQQSLAPTASDPVGDVHAHAPAISEVRRLLKLELVAAPVSSSTYIDPLRYVTRWERTDQGVDAVLPVGAPILAPGPVKILAIIPGWYAGQPLVYFELLNGPDAGKVQYVAEQITDIARPGTYVHQGQAVARYAKTGTAIEYGWSTPSGITLAVATTGYEEGQVTPAGRAMRTWLNGLGAGAGPS